MNTSIDSISSIRLDSETARTIDQLLSGIRERIATMGYDAVIEDLLDAGGSGEVIGSNTYINLFPSDHKGACTPILLVFSRGASGRAGFGKAMRHVRQHLTRCPITRSVLFFCDTFTKFGSEHAADWAAHAARGVSFRVFLAGSGLRGASELQLDLSGRMAPRARA